MLLIKTFSQEYLNETEWSADHAWIEDGTRWTHRLEETFEVDPDWVGEYEGAHSRTVALIGPDTKRYVLKIMRTKYMDENGCSRFRNEVRSQCLAAQHGLAPGIVDYGWMTVSGGSTLFILMERFGSSLAETLPRHVTRSLVQKVKNVLASCRAIGIKPCDVSLDNLLWDGQSVRLIDFDPISPLCDHDLHFVNESLFH